jgi:hypothetical protein
MNRQRVLLQRQQMIKQTEGGGSHMRTRDYKKKRKKSLSRTLVMVGVAGTTVPEIFQPDTVTLDLISNVPNLAWGVAFMSVRVSRVMEGILNCAKEEGREREGSAKEQQEK